MTYKQNLYKELVNNRVFSTVEKEDYIMFEKWYYNSWDVVKFLIHGWNLPLIWEKHQQVADILDTTPQNIRNWTIAKKILYLKKWYYNKHRFIVFLMWK